MSLIDDELAKAEAESSEARHRLAMTVVALQSRLKPSALARDAVEELKEAGGEMARSGLEAVKRNPLPAIGVTALLTAFVARKPLARLFRRQPTDA
jgi:thioesterase domain-containing protein